MGRRAKWGIVMFWLSPVAAALSTVALAWVATSRFSQQSDSSVVSALIIGNGLFAAVGSATGAFLQAGGTARRVALAFGAALFGPIVYWHALCPGFALMGIY